MVLPFLENAQNATRRTITHGVSLKAYKLSSLPQPLIHFGLLKCERVAYLAARVVDNETNSVYRALSRCRLMNVFGAGTDASSSNGTDLSCQRIKLVGKRQFDTAFQ